MKNPDRDITLYSFAELETMVRRLKKNQSSVFNMDELTAEIQKRSSSWIKTIDIIAKEWFDKVNGNSYFSAIVTINFGLRDHKIVSLPFQYGYGTQYEQEAFHVLQTAGILKSDTIYSVSRYCQENGIVLRSTKIENCTKSAVKSFTA